MAFLTPPKRVGPRFLPRDGVKGSLERLYDMNARIIFLIFRTSTPNCQDRDVRRSGVCSVICFHFGTTLSAWEEQDTKQIGPDALVTVNKQTHPEAPSGT